MLTEVQAEHGHVEDALVAAVVGLEAEGDRRAGVEAREQAAREEVRDEVAREPVDAGGHRRVRREDGGRAHLGESLVEARGRPG